MCPSHIGLNRAEIVCSENAALINNNKPRYGYIIFHLMILKTWRQSHDEIAGWSYPASQQASKHHLRFAQLSLPLISENSLWPVRARFGVKRR